MALSVVVTLSAISGLTSCSQQGNAATAWLSNNPIIQSTNLRLNGWLTAPVPFVTGSIKATATQDQIRQLAEDASGYLAKPSSNGLVMHLEYGKVEIDVDTSREQSAANVDLAARLQETRVISAVVESNGSLVFTHKADLTSLYAKYRKAGRTLVVEDFTVNKDSYQISEGISGKPCVPFPALLLDEYERLITKDHVGSAYLTCNAFEVRVSGTSNIAATTAEFRKLASDPTLSGFDFTVRSDDEKSAFTASAVTAELMPFFAFLKATPGVASFNNTEDGVSVAVTDKSALRPVVMAIAAARPWKTAKAVSIFLGKSSIYVNGDGTTPTQLTFVESLLASTSDLSVNVHPDSKVEFNPKKYTDEIGRKIVDAMVTSGFDKTLGMQLSVATPDGTIFFVRADPGAHLETIENDGKATTTTAIQRLSDYWDAKRLASIRKPFGNPTNGP